MYSTISEIIKPILTEKTYKQLSDGVHTFEVNARSTKHSVAKAIEHLFKIKPIHVKIQNVKPYEKNFKGRTGIVKGYKKALVKMPENFKLSSN